MHYYIYPKNWDGEDICLNLKIINKDCLFSFIDDSDDEMSLQSQYDKIRKDGDCLVLIASKYRYFELESNLKKYGISNYVDGLKFCAKGISKYYKYKFLSDANLCSVGLLVTQLPHLEHIDKVAMELNRRNIPIIFFCSDMASYQRCIERYKDSYVVMTRCDLFEHIDCVSVMHVTSHYAKVHSNVISILNPQGLLDPVQNYFYFSKEKAHCLIGSRINFDYIFCHTREMQNFYQNLLSRFAHPSKFVFVGYPSLEAYIDEFKKIPKSKITNKTVIVAFTLSILREDGSDMSGINTENIKAIVFRLLDRGFKVIFRPHPEVCKALFAQEIINVFKDNCNFVYDNTPRMTKEIMEQSLTIIGNGSSVMQTFPLATKKPAIMFMPDDNFVEELGENLELIVNPKLHLMARNIDEIMEAIEKIQENMTEYNNIISTYYERSISSDGSLGYSKIVDFLEKLLNKVRQSRMKA